MSMVFVAIAMEMLVDYPKSVPSRLGGLELENQEVSSMQEYDLYINPRKLSVGLYTRAGAGLPDLAHPEQWVFDGTMAECELPSDLVQRIEAHGHAFRELG